MKIRLVRIPAGFGDGGIEILPDRDDVKIITEKVGIYPIVKVPGGGLKELVWLLDHGFCIELISWEVDELKR